MSKLSGITQKPATAQAFDVFKVAYPLCPTLHVEARDEDDAAQKYRDYYDLHRCRNPKVERANGGR
jgi:hypothetical protein